MKKTDFEKVAEFVRSKGNMKNRSGFKSVDGGILIPDELLELEYKKVDQVDLTEYVETVQVNNGSGKYPFIKKSNGRFVSVDELEENPELANPIIEEVDYDIKTYRGYIPISEEAIDDADYDILQLLRENLKEQERNTKNDQIVETWKTAPKETVQGLEGLITLINTKLKEVHNVKLYLSSSLFNELDLIKDDTGRYLLSRDITVPSKRSIKGKEVIVLDDDLIGETEGDLVGFVGDAYQYTTLFDRRQVTARWVDNTVYGQLLAAFMRFDVRAVDSSAGHYITYTLPITED